MRTVLFVFIIVAVLALITKFFNLEGFHKGYLVRTVTHCSDVCPNYTVSFSAYVGVYTEEKCLKMEGRPMFDHAWGRQFIGCAVK